jgi:hypothetical protein
VLQVETHANGSLSPCKMFADCAEEAALEHDSSLDMAHKLNQDISACLHGVERIWYVPISCAALHEHCRILEQNRAGATLE